MTTISNRAVSPPLSETHSDCNLDSLSKSDKALLKRKTLNNNNQNFPNEDVPATGLRGRKTFAFWTIVCLLFILAVGNLILTFTILGVLRLGQGMESLELVPEASVVKFFGNTDLDRLYKRDGKLQGFSDTPVHVDGNDGAIIFNLASKNRRPENKVFMDKNGTAFRGISKFEVKDSKTGNKIFSTESPTLRNSESVNQINVKLVSTNKITSPVDDTLHLRAGASAHLRGNEGTNMESREIVWSADQDIYLKSINGSLILSGTDGVSIDIKSIPIASGLHFPSKSTPHFKVCVCMPQGKLFRVPIPSGHASRITCTHINMSPQHNPCM